MFFGKSSLLTAEMIAREIALLGSRINKHRGFDFVSLPRVTIRKVNFDSDSREIIVEKDNLRTWTECPELALAMSLDDFSDRYLQPVAEKLYYENKTNACI